MNKLLLAVTSLTMVGSSFNVLATEVENMHYRGNSVSAYCYSYDYEPYYPWCSSYKNVSVWAAENVTHDGSGKPEKSTDGYVYAYYWNSCYYPYYEYVYEPINISKFQVQGGQLNSAELEGNTESVTIDLSFVGIGDLYRGNYRDHYRYGNTSYMSRYNGSYREASVEGSVMRSGINLFDDCDYEYGEISHSNNGWKAIYRD
jgi:hypothetical protein